MVNAIRSSLDREFEIVIIDDGSFDDTRAISQTIAERVVVLPCQSGAARARNEGIVASTGEVILLVDSDVVVSEAAVSALLNRLASGYDAVFGAYTPLPPPEARSIATDYKNHVHHVTHSHGGLRDVNTFWSGFSAIRREAFLAVGGFDPGVTRSADVEDIHLGYRLTAAGFRVAVDPSCQVEHLKRYNVRAMFASDVFHRAIPWTRAMLEMRTFRADLNLAGSSLLGVAAFLLGVVSAALAPFTNLAVGLGASIVLFSFWLWTQRVLVRSCLKVGGLRLGFAAVLFGAAFCFYAPVGAVLGAFVYLLRPANRSIRNSVPLERKRPSSSGLPLSIVLVTTPSDDHMQIAQLIAQFQPDARCEILLVTSSPATELAVTTAHIQVVEAPVDEGPRDRCQRGLNEAVGRGVVFLEPGLHTVDGWIETAIASSERGFLVTGGSFSLSSTTAHNRAASYAWFWPWRAEAPERWIEDHPTMNTVFETAALRQIGGLSDRASIYRRLSVFGARVVHFDPTLRVNVRDDFAHRSMRQRFSLSKIQAMTMTSYYDNGVLLRFGRSVRVGLGIPFVIARRIRRAVHEGVADQVFWRSIPFTALWVAADAAGTIAGCCSRRGSTKIRADQFAESTLTLSSGVDLEPFK